jgi:hypothetical protein
MKPLPKIVVHRVNERRRLREIPHSFGAEIDLRAEGSTLVLNHDPFNGGEKFIDWLDDYQHGLLVLNIKEAGIEAEVIRLVEARGITEFFLLDVEFPYLYRASRAGERRIAVRYSEDETIETVLNYHDRVDWVWIDTNTRLPLDEQTVQHLADFKTCLVCPERWGRPADIPPYAAEMRRIGFQPTAIMTALPYAAQWSSFWTT